MTTTIMNHRFGIPHSAFVPLNVRDRRKAMLLLKNYINNSPRADASSPDHQQFVYVSTITCTETCLKHLQQQSFIHHGAYGQEM